jgi:hypothetical protein
VSSMGAGAEAQGWSKGRRRAAKERSRRRALPEGTPEAVAAQPDE